MSATANIFMHGLSQALRLPKEFRLPGKEVRVSKVVNKVILEPIGGTKFDFETCRAELDALGAKDFLTDFTREDPPLQPDTRKFLDDE